MGKHIQRKKIILIFMSILSLICFGIWLLACLFAAGQLNASYDLWTYFADAPIAALILAGLLILAIVCLVKALMPDRDINSLIEEADGTDGAVVIDVRESDEFGQGHIPGAINIPVGEIEKITNAVPDKDTPVYTYCLRGSRSRRAVKALKAMGYTDVTNMGGITKYKGARVGDKK